MQLWATIANRRNVHVIVNDQQSQPATLKLEVSEPLPSWNVVMRLHWTRQHKLPLKIQKGIESVLRASGVAYSTRTTFAQSSTLTHSDTSDLSRTIRRKSIRLRQARSKFRAMLKKN